MKVSNASVMSGCDQQANTAGALTLDVGSCAQLQSFNMESILRNITYFRVHDYVEQLAIVNMLDSLVMQNKQVKLVIIDSITFHFRCAENCITASSDADLTNTTSWHHG